MPTSPDRRSKYARAESPRTAEINAVVEEHIQCFPKVPAHYCRANSTMLYVDGAMQQDENVSSLLGMVAIGQTKGHSSAVCG
jgi:hypothetical protein